MVNVYEGIIVMISLLYLGDRQDYSWKNKLYFYFQEILNHFYIFILENLLTKSHIFWQYVNKYINIPIKIILNYKKAPQEI